MLIHALVVLTICCAFIASLPVLAEDVDHFKLGKEARRAGDVGKAIDEYLAALKTSDDSGIHYELGTAYLLKLRTSESIAELEKALSKGDLSKELKGKANDVLALAYMQSGQLSKAKICAAAAMNECPDERGYIDRSIQICLEAVKQDPVSSSNHVDLGKSRQSAGQFDEAKAEYMQALLFDPNSQSAKELLAKLGDAKKIYIEARTKPSLAK